MKWVCKICGKVIESDGKPAACPLCGANGEYIVLEKDFCGLPQKTEPKTKENLNAALALENNAAKDYFRYAKECKDIGDSAASELFTALAKVEVGHQSAIKRMLCVK